MRVSHGYHTSGLSRTYRLFQATELCPGRFFSFTEMCRFLAIVDSHTQFFGGCHVCHSS
jgi:hypothetical protein